MRARGSIQSLVLVGRDSFLALIEDRLAAAAAGEGRLLFVAGEAGIGKTRLLSAVARRADACGFAVVRAAAFPDDVQSLAGLLLDLAGNLLPAREPALSELGQNLTSRVRAISADAGDAHHHVGKAFYQLTLLVEGAALVHRHGHDWHAVPSSPRVRGGFR